MSILSRSASDFSRRSALRATALVLALALGATVGVVASQAEVSVLETGSSLVYPLFNLWVPVYQKVDPSVRITTQSTGSGTGISQSIEGIVQIGASDAYMADALMKQYSDMLNIPLCISSQMVNYNLPGLNGKSIKLSGPVLAGIYQGKITKWNDSQISAMNPGLSLPNHTIIPIHRSDGSGDTFIFTQFLAFSTPDWANSLSYGTTISWPAVSGELGAVGNPGMVTALKDNPYSMAYIGTSYKDGIEKDGLGIAMLKNRDGKFVLADPKTVAAAANVMVSKTPTNERISLIFAPGPASYPIINYEYALVKKDQPSGDLASSLRKFLAWAISPKGGNAPQFMTEAHFVALPSSVVKLSEAQIAQIK